MADQSHPRSRRALALFAGALAALAVITVIHILPPILRAAVLSPFEGATFEALSFTPQFGLIPVLLFYTFPIALIATFGFGWRPLRRLLQAESFTRADALREGIISGLMTLITLTLITMILTAGLQGESRTASFGVTLSINGARTYAGWAVWLVSALHFAITGAVAALTTRAAARRLMP